MLPFISDEDNLFHIISFFDNAIDNRAVFSVWFSLQNLLIESGGGKGPAKPQHPAMRRQVLIPAERQR